MEYRYRAAVLRKVGMPLAVERIRSREPSPTDVVVRIRVAGLCHTDLEVIDGSLRYPLPMILGHEGSGVVEEIGHAVHDLRVGDHVILSWNPHCGHYFYCDRGLPILCESYLRKGPSDLHFDGQSKAVFDRHVAIDARTGEFDAKYVGHGGFTPADIGEGRKAQNQAQNSNDNPGHCCILGQF